MLNLQTTFTYDDGKSTPPVDKATIVVTYPTYSLAGTSETTTADPALIATGHASSILRQRLLDQHYSLRIPIANVFGSQYGATLSGYLSPILRSGQLNLSDVSLKFEVNYGSADDSGQVATIETLYFFKLLKPIKPEETPRSSSTTASPPTTTTATPKFAVDGTHLLEQQPSSTSSSTTAKDTPTGSSTSITTNPRFTLPDIMIQHPDMLRTDDRDNVIDSNIYLLSKSAYKSFLVQLFPNLAPEKESVLLYMVNALVDLSGTSPTLAEDSEMYQRKLVNDVLTFYGLPTNNTVYDFLVKNFMQLFDMPLRMPKFKLLAIGGSIRFRNPPATVPFDDFVFYHLSSEYSVALGDERSQFHSTRYEWDKSGYKDNAVTFTYTENAILTSVWGRVTIRVKAFDQSELYRADFDPADPMLQKLDIVIDIRMPPALEGTSNVDGSSGQKIRGKIVPISKSCTLKGAVVIQAKKTASDPSWLTVSAGMSDKAGNFTLPYPAGQYAIAQAITSLDVQHPTPMSVDATSTMASISTDFLFILLQLDPGSSQTDSSSSGPDGKDTKSSDCNCNPQTLAGRLPSQDDLINSDQFTQDVGGGCINLTVPNRTLREYSYTALVRSSDPDVASYTLSSALNDQFIDVYQLAPNGKVKRGMIDLDNPVRWQDGDDMASTELTVYQSVTVATGVILYYKSEFRADGYSLGDLIYSLPLAPGQKKQIVVVDASSTMAGAESQNLSQSDSLANSLLSERSIIDNIAGNIGETLQGQSNASTSGVSAGLGAAGSAGFLGASLGVSGGYSNSNSSASQDSKRGLSEHFNEVLRQGLSQNASDYRRMNASAVTTVSEGQKYNVQTDVIANHNHCHSMTMMYFEVLRHFAIYQDLVDVEECVFVPLLMARFTKENVMKWADTLCTRMLPIPSNTFVRPASFGGQQIHSLVPAFDALERWRTNWTLVDFPDGAYDEEIIQEIQGSMLFKIDIPRPKTKYDFILSFPIMATAVTRQVTDAASLKDSFIKSVFTLGFSLFGDDGSRTETEIKDLPTKIVDAFIQIDDNFASVPPAQAIRVKTFAPFTVDGQQHSAMDYTHSSPIDTTMWKNYAYLLGYTDGPVPAEQQMMTYYFEGQLLSEWNTIWNQSIAPELYKAFLKTVTLNVGGSLTTLDNYYGGERYMTAYVSGSATSQRRKDITATGIKIKCNSSKLLSISSSPVTFVLISMNLTYDTAHYHGTLWSGTIDANVLEVSSGSSSVPVSDGISRPAPERADEKRNPKKEDVYMGNRLLQHLNSNMEYYNRVLWSGLDANRRFMLLDGFQIETFDKYGLSEGFRSLTSVLKNSLIAVVGNSLVLPVAPGYKVSQNFIVRRDSEAQTESLLDHFRPSIPQPPYRLSIPTRGVFAEAVMGNCNACEAVQPNSAQDWTKFTTDDPTAINAVQPTLPAPATYNPTIKDLAAPIVNVQNAPTMPDPSAGLAAVTSLLGKGDTFRDVTGLSGTQQTALQTLLSDNENAKAFAQMASSMVTQGHNTANSSAIMGTIKGAQSDGTLSSKDASALVKDHIQQQIDGGATKKADLAQQAAQGKPSVTGAAVGAATAGGKNVKASRTEGSDGTISESMEITDSSSGAGASQSAQAQVKDTIALVQQGEKTNGCWAAAATMMVSWFQKQSMEVEDVLRLAGGSYLDKWNNNETLSASEKDDFLGSLGLVGEPPASNAPKQYIDWINKYGPLWVTIDSSSGTTAWSPHAKILTQVNSDDAVGGTNTTMYFLDPSKSNATSSSFADFEKSFEEVASDNPGSKTFLQVVHFAAPIPDGEGYQFEGPWNIKEPVHENITLTAMVASKFQLSPSTQLWKDPQVNEFLRGVIWPDDPLSMMFDDKKNDNADFSSGLLYGLVYVFGGANCMLHRSHKGDLQFLHAMGSADGELPDDTSAKIRLWIEVMYRTALGEYTESTTLAAIPVVTSSRSASYRMDWVFERYTPAPRSMTLKKLLTANTKYTGLNLQRRALGALLHTIEDSYSHGHTRRVLLNPGDVLSQSDKAINFKAGTWGKWGAVLNFHVYPNKGHDNWDAYDKDKMNIADPASFNALVGARDAIDKVTKMVDFWVSKTPYDNGPRALVETDIFAVDSKASGSDRTSA